jgi:hypothetical protein
MKNKPSMVIPAKAETHRNRGWFCEECRPSCPYRRIMRYGSRRSPGRLAEGTHYGFKIDAPVVPRLSRSICALAASFSA